MLLEPCNEHGLCIASRHFLHKGDHTITWMHPNPKFNTCWIMPSLASVTSMTCNVKSFHGCWADRSLMIRVKESRGPVSILWRPNVHKIYDAVLKKTMEDTFSVKGN